MIINCPNCGKEISSKSKTCVHCGQKLVQKGKTKWPLFVIGAVVLLGSTLAFLLSKKDAQPDVVTISKEFSSKVNQFDYVSSCFPFKDGTSGICVRQNGKYGLLNTDGEFVVPCEYDDSICPVNDDVFCVKKNGKFGLINGSGEILVPCNYDSRIRLYDDRYSKSLAILTKGNKVGILNIHTLSEVLPCSYSYEDFKFAFEGEDLLWLNRNGKYALIDSNGVALTDYLYSSVWDHIKYEVCPVCKNGKWGFIDKTGKEIPNSFQNEYLYYADYGWGAVPPKNAVYKRDCGQWVYYDTRGNLLSKTELSETIGKTVYDVVGTKYSNYRHDGSKYGKCENKYHGGFAIVDWFDFRCNKAFYGLIDELGNEVIRPSSDGRLDDYLLTDGYVYKSYSKEFSTTGERENIGILDTNGTIIIPCENEDVEYLGDGLFIVKKNETYGLFQANEGFINSKRYNNVSTDFGYTHEGHVFWYVPLKHIDSTNNALIAVEGLTGGWGLIDRNGLEISDCVYEEIRYSEYPVVIVKKDDKWGIIDLKGQEIAACVYDEICDFSCNLARVKKGDKYGFIDIYGNTTFPKQ